MTIVAVEKH